MHNPTDNLNVADIDNAIKMLTKYVNDPSVKPLISTLESLKQDVDSESLLVELTEIWRGLGVLQGAVLTYVPYFYTFIPDDIFGDDV